MKKTCRPLSRLVENSSARAGQAVAPRAAGLLVVGLDRGRDGLVADRPHVGLVHAHPERVGGDDDGRGAVHEAPLHVRAQLPRQPCVIGDHLHAELPPQPVGEPVRLRARARVDDRRQRALLGQGRGDPPGHRLLVGTRHDGVGQVRAVEPRRDVHRLAQPEPGLDDVPRHLGRGRGGGGDDGLRAEPARRVREPEVVRPEVVPPLGHAVRLVDHEQADPRLPQPFQEAGRGEPLRRDVQHAHPARDGAVRRPAGSPPSPAGR